MQSACLAQVHCPQPLLQVEQLFVVFVHLNSHTEHALINHLGSSCNGSYLETKEDIISTNISLSPFWNIALKSEFPYYMPLYKEAEENDSNDEATRKEKIV